MKDSAAKREIPGPGRKDIPTLVKDSSLVEERRRRLVEAAVGLFVRKGYHATTTREIALLDRCVEPSRGFNAVRIRREFPPAR